MIHINNVHSDDEGVWAIRPRSLGRNQNISTDGSSSRPKFKSATWCNFTLEVLEDLEELPSVDDGIQMVEKQRQQEVVGRSNSQTRSIHPEFRRLERRKKPQIIVKRTGESVALKCPVHGIVTF